MPDNTSSLSNPVRGMNTDVHPMSLGEQGYDYALNAVVEEFNGNGFPLLQNEASNLPFASFPAGYFVVGFANVIEQQRIILFLSNTSGGSEIGEIIGKKDCGKLLGDDDDSTSKCDDCGAEYVPIQTDLTKLKIPNCATYSTIINDSCLNFSIKAPIGSIVYNILPCSLQVFFTDDVNPRRWIEFDYVNDDPSQGLIIRPRFFNIIGFEPAPCNDPIYGTTLDCNALNVQPNIVTPCIDFVEEVGGGSLIAGVYQFFICMSDVSGNKLTSFLSATNPIPVFTKVITNTFDYITDRSIKLAIQNLDPLGVFQYYDIAVAKTINNFTSFALVGTFPVTQDTFTYTGNTKGELPLTESDIFTLYPYYVTAGSVAKSNGILFWANVAEPVRPNLQRVANNITLQWQTIAIPEAIYNQPTTFQKYRGYMRDEVYPFGIVFIYNDGEESNAYHIPGRASIPSDFTLVDNNDTIQENNCVDCGSTSPITPVTPVFGPGGDCTTTPITPSLNPDNGHQSASCPLTPFTGTGCTPVTIANPPIVNAGPDQTIAYVGFVSLNGSATPISPNIITSILWTQLSGPNAVIIANPITLNTTFSNINSGTYIFQLCVQDNVGNIVTDTVTYTVNVPVNVPPIADPGGDQIITLPATIGALNGSASSDPDGTIAIYAWTQLSGPNTATLDNPASVYVNMSGLIVGTYQFQLTVTDNRGCSSSGTTLVYVIPDPCSVVPTCSILQYPINGSVTSSFSLVSLQWQTVPCATSYDVFLKLHSAGSFTLIGNSITTNFSVTGLASNSLYDWYVVPKSGIGDATGCAACFFSFATPVTGGGNTCQKQRWQVYNTGTVEGGTLDIYNGCDESCYQFGNMSYWESTEKYPNNPPNFDIWGDLCGEPIRHHKFPDSTITHIHDNLNGSLDYTRSNIIYVLGVKINYASVTTAIANAITANIITATDAARIIGYRIVRGNRFDNKSVVAKGLIFDVNQYQRKNGGTNFDQSPIYFSNYPFNDLRDNPFITDNFDNYKKHNSPVGPNLPFIASNRYTFHSPDTHFAQVLPGTVLKLETTEYGQAQGYYSVSKLQAKQRFLSDTAYAIAFTAGVVAAMLQLQPKTEKDYTVKGSVVSGLGLAAGIWGPYLPYQGGEGAAIIPESVIDTSLNLSNAAAINAATEVTTRTVQGKATDFVNPLYLAEHAPYLLPIYPFMLANFLSSFLTTVLQEANIILDLIESLTPFRDWCVQYQATGNYNAYKPVADDSGVKIRQIDSYSYLDSDNVFVNEPSQTSPGQTSFIRYNNYQRESSLYLRYTGIPFPNAGTSSGITDTSRTPLGDGLFGCTLNKNELTNISSYYASLKNFVPDQYGTVYNIQYLPTDSCTYAINTSSLCRGVYGGDTFINRFALKVKVPYFLNTTFRLPNDTDFAYDLVPNLAIPRNYYDNTAGPGTNIDNIGDILSIFTPSGMATLLGRPKSIRDCSTNKFFYQNGYIYLYHYSIPYFLVESDYNVNYRNGTNNLEGDFYPHQQDLDFWLQEENVPIKQDNTYFYNNSYSKQNKETFIGIDPPTFEPGRACRVTHPNRIIYSDPNQWLVYRANNFYDYPLSKGKIISVEGIENQTVLVRTENSTSIFKSILRIPVDGQTVQVGNGSVFSNPPQDFAETTLGYIGTQHRAILHTEYGHIWADAKRGQVFNISLGGQGLQLDEISKDGMKNWFKNNLPFQLLKDFPTMTDEDLDNAFDNIGLILCFDKRFNRFILTKLDYQVLPSMIPAVQWDPILKEFYILVGEEEHQVVNVTDIKYFCNKSWTISYNFFTKSWVSFHSFLPNYYIEGIDYYISGSNSATSKAWIHNQTNKSYQVFNGKLWPFTVQTITKPDIHKNNLNSIYYALDVIRYHNKYDPFYTIDITFNKAIVFTQNQNSGYLDLSYHDKRNLQTLLSYPIQEVNYTKVRVTNADGIWRINTFYDIVSNRLNNMPIWLNNCANTEKTLNQQALDYQMPDLNKRRIRGEYVRVRLTNDKHSNYKFLFKWLVNNSVKTYR